jgi:iron complex outermembrane receptor protein
VDGVVNGTIVPEFYQEEDSLYGQLDFHLTNDLRLLAGTRYTHNQDVGDHLTPRMGAVYTFTDQQSVKLLYSEGFNTPSFTQQRGDLEGLVSNSRDLDPETVDSVDLAYSYVTASSMFVANLFYLKAEDMVLKRRVNNVIEFFNAGAFERWGAELDVKYRLFRNWSLVANAAYHYQGNSDEDYASAYVPELTTAWGISWHQGDHQLGVSLRTIGPRAGNDSLEILNGNYQYTFENWQFFLTLRNILDQEIVHPHVSDFDERLFPSDDDFNFLLGMKFIY